WASARPSSAEKENQNVQSLKIGFSQLFESKGALGKQRTLPDIAVSPCARFTLRVSAPLRFAFLVVASLSQRPNWCNESHLCGCLAPPASL
ncbi:MAG: hypothetical protein L0338_18730, partial [Acidobacteria bacterium]|nr:hypothetical protein [Acidobacteriota bacterium]